MKNLSEIEDNRWFSLIFKVYEKRIVKVFELFRSANIEPILIKGWAVARLYPSEFQRPFADIDLCVAAEDFEKAEKLLQTEAAEGLGIDLHCGLRHLDTLEWVDLFKNSILVNIDETPVRILRPEDHLRVLCVHWLTDSGARKDRLWDVFYTFHNEEDFDWERCLNSVSEIRRRWIVCIIGMVEKYFNVSLVNTPFEFEKIYIPEWLIEACEKEWKNNIPLKPLHLCLADPRELLRQINKRFPPNPIQATIETEGSFDSRSRVFYQFKNFFQRLSPSYRRIKYALLNR